MAESKSLFPSGAESPWGREQWDTATVEGMRDYLDRIGPPWGNSKLLASRVIECFWIAYEALNRLEAVHKAIPENRWEPKILPLADVGELPPLDPTPPLREWVVYRELTTRQVYTGIKARTREEALEQWHHGEGDIELEREQFHTNLDAMDVRPPVSRQ